MKLSNKFLSFFNLRISHLEERELINNNPFLMQIKRGDSADFFLRRDNSYFGNLISFGFGFIFDKNRRVIAEFNKTRFFVTSIEELFILNEIFVEGRYNYFLSHDHLVIDIGMNVGFSSLLFASVSNVKKVIAYEPVMQTYEMGLENLNLNPTWQSKIESYNLGVGQNSRVEEFVFSIEWKGSVGLRGLSESRLKSTKKPEIVKVNLIDVSQVIDHAKSFNLPIVVKIDCEGAEYEILERLESIDEIRSVEAFIIEWHEKGPQLIINILKKADMFTIFCNPGQTQETGMIYAVRYSRTK
jgi:FkbM family methyltransferase